MNQLIGQYDPQVKRIQELADMTLDEFYVRHAEAFKEPGGVRTGNTLEKMYKDGQYSRRVGYLLTRSHFGHF